jgi:hypothetical protein
MRAAAVRGCGRSLAGAAAVGVQRLQEFDIAPPPPPRVTEYRVQAKVCGRCRTVTAGQPPAGITGRAQYGPEVHAPGRQPGQPASRPGGPGRGADERDDGRDRVLWLGGGVRGKAAARLAPFMDQARDLLRSAGSSTPTRLPPARRAACKSQAE